MTTPVQPDQVCISIEMGDEYQPSERLAAALGELAATLAEEESDSEVSGYRLGTFEIQDFKALSFDSTSATGLKGEVILKVVNKSEPAVFKF